MRTVFSSIKMAANPASSVAVRRHHNRGLLLIAVYKLLQALLFTAIGVGALHLLHRDVADLLAALADHLNFNPESGFVNFILDKALLVDDPLLRRIGAAAFCYAGVSLAEGIGLYLEKAWGEFLTIAITASFLPLEAFELLHRFTAIRICLLAINTFVLIYLVRVVADKARERQARHAQVPHGDIFTVSSPYSKSDDSSSVSRSAGTK